MTKEEFKAAMEDCFGDDYDPEGAHSYADSIMCELLRELGFGDGIDIFEAAKKWYA